MDDKLNWDINDNQQSYQNLTKRTLTDQPQKRSKANYLILITIALSLCLIFGFGGYYLGRKSKENTKEAGQKNLNSTLTTNYKKTNKETEVNKIYYDNTLTPAKDITLFPTPAATKLISPVKTNNVYKSGWKLYQDNIEKFQFFYPSDYQLSTLKKDESRGRVSDILLLNHQIIFGVKSYSEIKSPDDCKGDCPLKESEENLIINNYQAKKIKGMVGGIGGNIPFSYITYEIKLPSDKKFFFFTYNSIPQDLTYQQLLEKYGPMGNTEISSSDEKIFDEIVSTFKIIE